jgi:hypothetical protein
MPVPKVYEHPETGLKSAFQQTKAAVSSQFRRRNSEYAVAGIRYREMSRSTARSPSGHFAAR